jgi:hypothetical protein
MSDAAARDTEAAAPLPELILYTRHGCHLCDDTRETLRQLLTERSEHGKPVPRFVERDISTNNTWLREYFELIPVVEIGAHRLELATNVSRLRRLLAEAVDTERAQAPA